MGSKQTALIETGKSNNPIGIKSNVLGGNCETPASNPRTNKISNNGEDELGWGEERFTKHTDQSATNNKNLKAKATGLA